MSINKWRTHIVRVLGVTLMTMLLAAGLTPSMTLNIENHAKSAVEMKDVRGAIAAHVRVRATYYADKFEGRPMAGGGKFSQDVPSAASLTYPLKTNLFLRHVPHAEVAAAKSIILSVTDRGPYSKKYKLDLSKAAYKMLGCDLKAGWCWVDVEVLE